MADWNGAWPPALVAPCRGGGSPSGHGNPLGAAAADRLKTLPAKARFDAGTLF
jgi:hypothetical protein